MNPASMFRKVTCECLWAATHNVTPTPADKTPGTVTRQCPRCARTVDIPVPTTPPKPS